MVVTEQKIGTAQKRITSTKQQKNGRVLGNGAVKGPSQHRQDAAPEHLRETRQSNQYAALRGAQAKQETATMQTFQA